MASDHLLNLEGLVLTESEGTYNTDAIDGNLGGANDYYYQAYKSAELLPVVQLIENREIRASFDGIPHDLIKDHLSVSLSADCRDAPTPGTDGPRWGAELKAAGLSESISSGAQYAPSTTQTAGMTVYRFHRNAEDGNYRLIYATGVRGSLELSFAIGQPVNRTFTGLSANFPDTADTADFNGWSNDLAFIDSSGKIILDKDGSTAIAATSGTVAYDTGARFICQSITVTVDAVTYPLNALTFSTGKQATPVQTMNGSQIASKILCIPSGRPGGNMVLAQSAAAYENMLANWLGASEVSLTVNATSADGGTMALTSSDLQFYAPQPQDNGGVKAYSVDYRLNGAYANPAGDDAYEIAFS